MHVSTTAFTALPLYVTSSSDESVHVIDTGATIHCTPYRDLLFNVHSVPIVLLTVANSEQLVLNLAGDMVVEVDSEQTNGTSTFLMLKNVYFNSSLPFTLISVSKLDSDYCFTFYRGICTIYDSSSSCIAVLKKSNDLYSLSMTRISSLASVHKSGITFYDLHKKLGHISYFQIKKLLETSKLIITTPIIDRTETPCEDCIMNNIRRNAVPKLRTSPLAKAFGDHFHIDIFGPLPTESIIGRYLYWLTIVDDATRWLILAPLRTKDDAYTPWVIFSTELLTQYGIRVKILQSDNDSVFVSKEMMDYLKSQGTIARLTVHDTPAQNDVAERVHQTIMTFIRVNLHTAALPNRLWWYAALHAMYVYNRSPRAPLKYTTPYSKRYGTEANLDGLQTFGQPCIVYDEYHANKLAPKGKRGVWLGFAEHSKGHYIYFGRRIGVERNVQFVDSTAQIEGEKEPNLEPLPVDKQLELEDNPHVEPMDIDEPEPTGPKCSTRIPKASRRARGLQYDKVDTNIAFYLTEFNASYAIDVGDPTSFNDVLNHPLKDDWLKSMKIEVDKLEQLGTWEYCIPPPNANITGSHFVYRTKHEQGKVTELKSRLVAQGYSQRDGIDFYSDDTFAPVARMSSMRFVLTLAASQGFEIVQLDIKSAYLYGKVNDDEDLYLCPPPGNLLPNLPKGWVLKLRKTIYGLKQAGRRWYKVLCDILFTLGLQRSNFDNAVFYCYRENTLILILTVHVDDITLCTITKIIGEQFETALRQHVEITNGGTIHWMLGMEVDYDKAARSIKLRQKGYIETILKRYNFDHNHTRRTPMIHKHNLAPRSSKEPRQDADAITHYMSLVGGLHYVADSTRPDIAYCTGQLARYLSDPGIEHFAAAKQCYLYLKGTCDHWLVLENQANPVDTSLVGYADSDGMTTYGNKPIMGYTFTYNDSLISWSSKRGSLVTLLVTEAELYALAHASTEAIYLKQLIDELTNSTMDPVKLYSDSASTLAIVKSPEEQYSQRTKHFEIRKNFISDRIEKKFITVHWISSNDQCADTLTKALSLEKLKHFNELLHIRA